MAKAKMKTTSSGCRVFTLCCRHGEPLQAHNCDYVDARSRLVSKAEVVAYKVCGAPPPSNAQEYNFWASLWNITFFAAMDELWASRGEALMAEVRKISAH